MASHKNHNLSANEGFIILLTSKINEKFTLQMKSQSIVIYSMEVNLYIGLWTLKVKCTQCGICG